MRAQLVLLGMFTVGCSMDNPAFETGAASGGEVGTASEGTGTGDENSSGSSSAEAGSAEGQEAPEPVCPLEPGLPLQISLGLGNCLGDLPENFSTYRVLDSIGGHTISAFGCESDNDCSLCPMGRGAVPIAMEFSPLELDGMNAAVDIGACLRISAHRVNPDNPNGCEFQTVLVESVSMTGAVTPLLLASNTPGVMLPALGETSGLSQFSVMTDDGEMCSCGDYPAECCDGVPTKLLTHDIGSGPLAIGERAPFVATNGSSYEFISVDGYASGVCDEPRREAWALIIDPL